jgi:hypothetical protein
LRENKCGEVFVRGRTMKKKGEEGRRKKSDKILIFLANSPYFLMMKR